MLLLGFFTELSFFNWFRLFVVVTPLLPFLFIGFSPTTTFDYRVVDDHFYKISLMTSNNLSLSLTEYLFVIIPFQYFLHDSEISLFQLFERVIAIVAFFDISFYYELSRIILCKKKRK